MQLLILGGTVFLGRHIVEAALDRGHTVTLFNRGESNPDLYPDVEQLRGDRDANLPALEGRRWDAVIDTCGFVPRVVQASAEWLADATDYYTFISSLSVYSDLERSGIDESGPITTLPPEVVAGLTDYRYSDEHYGPLKALCEAAAERAMPGRVLVVRPGLIVGPHDPTDRFTYWLHRIARGGAVLAPGDPAAAVRFIDVRDLAIWLVQMVETHQTGTFNANGPTESLTLGQLFSECRRVSGSDAHCVWVDESFLLAAGVTPWRELPLWIPDPAEKGFWHFNYRKAILAGLISRPLTETIHDTLVWESGRPAPRQWRAGLTPEREQQLLEAWAARSRTG
jgi:2'-hydroxyisoflavone reductase